MPDYEFEQWPDLARVKPGWRFVLAYRADGQVRHAGVMLVGGDAVMDMLNGQHLDPPVVLQPDELFGLYDPDVHEVAVIGGSV